MHLGDQTSHYDAFSLQFDVALFDSAPRNWVENEPDVNESLGEEAEQVQPSRGQMILPNAAFDALRPAMPRIMLFSVMCVHGFFQLPVE